MSLSGFYNIGHDVGGFSGPKPGPELFVRWVQNGIFHPRFTIHSWNDDGTVNEPWMYPEVLPQIRAALALRYRLLPYLYTCLWQAADADEPMLRPLFLDFPEDPACWQERDEFMLGRDLLVANVMDAGAETRVVQLPRNATGWWDFHSGAYHAPGSRLELPVDLGSMPLFVRAGAVLPVSAGAMRADPSADQARDLLLFPTPGEASEVSLFYEDDGISEAPEHSLLRFTLASTDSHVTLDWQQAGSAAPILPSARVILPAGETRGLRAGGRDIASHDEVEL